MFWKKKEAVSPTLRWSLVAAFAAALVLNGLAAGTTLLGGMMTGQVSDAYPNLFAPVGATFSIWSVIYLLLIAFTVYVFGFGRPKKSALKGETLAKVTRLLSINLLLNGAWILAWQYQVIWLSMLLIVAILVTLVMIVNELRGVELGPREYVMAKLPFSVYFGWITVATIANVTTWLVSIDWNGFGVRDGVWMVAVLLVGAAIALFTANRNRDWAYLAVVVWAFAGILVKHLSPGGFDGDYPSVIVTLTILLSVMVMSALLLVRQWWADTKKLV